MIFVLLLLSLVCVFLTYVCIRILKINSTLENKVFKLATKFSNFRFYAINIYELNKTIEDGNTGLKPSYHKNVTTLVSMILERD